MFFDGIRVLHCHLTIWGDPTLSVDKYVFFCLLEIGVVELDISTQRLIPSEKPTDQGMFEICTHKWSDLSESRFGTALLNDCKYGISVEGSDLRLTLHKGGTHPDPRGDIGVHELVYAFLPHNSGFDVENVIRKAYELNVPPLTIHGVSRVSFTSLAVIDTDHVIIETVKPAEEDDAFVLRLYEAERCAVNGAKLQLGMKPKRASLVNLLEEELEELVLNGPELTLNFRPFEIKTVKIYF